MEISKVGAMWAKSARPSCTHLHIPRRPERQQRLRDKIIPSKFDVCRVSLTLLSTSRIYRQVGLRCPGQSSPLRCETTRDKNGTDSSLLPHIGNRRNWSKFWALLLAGRKLPVHWVFSILYFGPPVPSLGPSFCQAGKCPFTRPSLCKAVRNDGQKFAIPKVPDIFMLRSFDFFFFFFFLFSCPCGSPNRPVRDRV